MSRDSIDILRVTTVSISLEKLLNGQIHFMEESGMKIATASFGEFDFHRHYTIKSLRRAISPIRDLLAILELYRLIKKLQPSIVHSHTPKAGLIGMWAAKFAGVPYRVHTVAGMPLMAKEGMMRGLLVQMERLTYAAATMVWPNSYGLKKYIKENIYSGSKLDVVGRGTSNGINLEKFSSAALNAAEIGKIRTKYSLDSITFIFIGRLVGDKGIAELIEAFEMVSQEYKDIKLLLVGAEEPTLDPLPVKTKQSISASENILAVGFQQDVRPYIAVSDILVFPSYREGFPNVPLQCGALGKALILSDINGCNEIVANASLGKIVPIRNVDAIVSAMKFLLHNPEKRIKMGQNVQAHIAENFGQTVIWDELLLRYRKMLE